MQQNSEEKHWTPPGPSPNTKKFILSLLFHFPTLFFTPFFSFHSETNLAILQLKKKTNSENFYLFIISYWRDVDIYLSDMTEKIIFDKTTNSFCFLFWWKGKKQIRTLKRNLLSVHWLTLLMSGQNIGRLITSSKITSSKITLSKIASSKIT